MLLFSDRRALAIARNSQLPLIDRKYDPQRKVGVWRKSTSIWVKKLRMVTFRKTDYMATIFPKSASIWKYHSKVGCFSVTWSHSENWITNFHRSRILDGPEELQTAFMVSIRLRSISKMRIARNFLRFLKIKWTCTNIHVYNASFGSGRPFLSTVFWIGKYSRGLSAVSLTPKLKL